MYISTFLGNKGQKFKNTRHNLAWMMLDSLSFVHELSWNSKFKAEYSKYGAAGVLLKPMTMMNLSGDSVAAAMSFFREKPESLIVVHDDLELPFGTVQLKKGGGAGGHNGLRSIIKMTGSSGFFRFRMGISRPPASRDVSSWVLNRFSPEEEAVLDDYCSAAAALFENLLKKPLAQGRKENLL